MKAGRKSSFVHRFTSIRSSTVAWPPSLSSGGASITGPIIKSSKSDDCVSANKHSKGASSSRSIPYAVIAWEETFNLVVFLPNPLISSLFLEWRTKHSNCRVRISLPS